MDYHIQKLEQVCKENDTDWLILFYILFYILYFFIWGILEVKINI
jgi:hypothetical protein